MRLFESVAIGLILTVKQSTGDTRHRAAQTLPWV